MWQAVKVRVIKADGSAQFAQRGSWVPYLTQM
jgi:hypothetical protein